MSELEEVKRINDQQAQRILELEFQLKELKRLIFGAKSEKRKSDPAHPNQLSLFDLPNETEDVEVPSHVEVPAHKRKQTKEKKKPLRLEIPEDLERRTQVIEPDPIPEGAVNIGTEVTEVLEYEPGKLYVRRIERPKYAIPVAPGEAKIIIGDLPSMIIPKGNAGVSLLVFLFVSKFVDHLPFHRIAKILARNGIKIPESTINGWFAAVCKYLEILYDQMIEEITSGDYVCADETGLPVLTKDSPKAAHKGYLWAYYSPVNKLVVFDYQPGRGKAAPNAFLKDFQGFLQVDGYAGYNDLARKEGVTALGCLAHARRKFEHAKDNDAKRANKALDFIGALYAIEAKAREDKMNTQERKAYRLEYATPVWDAFEAWLEAERNSLLPQSAIGKAFGYTLEFWNRLKVYLQDGRLEIDNNLIENTIRPVALGRKNFMFAGSHEGAKRTAIMYTMLGTCKAREANPTQWMTELLSKLPDHPANRVLELLP